MVTTDAIAADYQLLREGCGIFDRSGRGKLALSGPDAKSFLQGQVTNDVEALRPGDGCYAAFLTHKGKMLGDLRVLDTETELWLDTERVALQELFNMIRRFKVGYDVELHKRTLECSLISLIGPQAAVLVDADLPDTEHAHGAIGLADLPARAVRTDVGIDLICEAARREELVAALARRGGRTVGEAAVECLRIERGRPRFGVELDETTIPQEAALNDRAVSLVKGCYVGQETVARLYYRGKPNRHLRGLKLSAPAAIGSEIELAERTVGVLGSAAVHPELGPIGLALVRREATAGDRVEVAGVEAAVVKLPFQAD